MTQTTATFRCNLEAVLSRKGVSMVELARRMGVSRSTAYRIASCATQPTLDQLDSISRALSVKPHALLRPMAA